MKFESLGIRPEIVKALKEMGIEKPNQVQEKAIPPAREGKDVIGISKTGSGKTLAFGSVVLEKITHGKGLQALIITPTRELAVQVAAELEKFSSNLNFSITTIFGGVPIEPQAKKLRTSDIMVGTPGRVLDHLKRGNLPMKDVSIVVLDEADKMTEMGFIEDIEAILRNTPDNKQMLLFGATISERIAKIRDRWMRKPVTVRGEEHVQKDFLEQYYVNVQPMDKVSLLVHYLKKEKRGKTIIFCSTRRMVERLFDDLKELGFKAAMIHGKMDQSRRLKVMERFNQGDPHILIASAVAARGLDIKEVTHVFNYDLPKDPEEYIHRIGRTARAGESGKAITLLSQRDHDNFRKILGKYRVNVEKLPRESFPKVKTIGRGRERPEPSFRGRGGHERQDGDRPRRTPFRGRRHPRK